ncbi:MAG: hypothetical protein ACK4M3_00840 [Pyrobaculum sp.]
MRESYLNWVVFMAALVATAGLLFATLPAGSKEPVHKLYWEDQTARQNAIQLVSQVAILTKRGDSGVVIVGYRDEINATNRAELLQVLSNVLKMAEGYTVYLAPWATDGVTRQYLSLLYNNKLTLEEYLHGVVKIEHENSTKIDGALELARFLAKVYGSYKPLGGSVAVQTPPIYIAVFRNDTTYVVYEPFTVGRDQTFTDWLQWVKTIFDNLKTGQGRVTP